MRLTDAKIRAARPGETTKKLSDGGGLQLHVTPAGGKLWRLAYRFEAKQRTLAIGRYPDISLKAARNARDAAKALIAEGRDPSVEKRKAKIAPPTWAEVALEFLEHERQRGRAEGTVKKLAHQIDHTIRAFGDRPIAELRASDLLPLLRVFERGGKHETARQVRALCSRIFRYAVATDRCENDPAAVLTGALVSPPRSGYPAITNREEVGALMRALRGYAGEPTTATALRVLAYTFLRPGEVISLRWTDVDWSERLISIPAARMKMNRPHLVPISRQVAEALRALQPWTGDGPLIFPSLRAPGKAISNNTLNAALPARPRPRRADEDHPCSHRQRQGIHRPAVRPAQARSHGQPR
ncbi:DUF4102 domain-containing protein, partial [Rhodovulum sp. 12E13]|uniref:tyrosine-type recombinase/integrase n=1 Tax=Rhodovulum sp. 12E13 TaxID=2203891 RepID=UPI000E17BAE8